MTESIVAPTPLSENLATGSPLNYRPTKCEFKNSLEIHLLAVFPAEFPSKTLEGNTEFLTTAVFALCLDLESIICS